MLVKTCEVATIIYCRSPCVYAYQTKQQNDAQITSRSKEDQRKCLAGIVLAAERIQVQHQSSSKHGWGEELMSEDQHAYIAQHWTVR